MKPERTLSYARVSTAGQLDGYSLAAQEARITAYCAYQGWPEPITFRDEAVSGTRDDRPGLLSLLATLRDGDVVVVYSINRLGRAGVVQLLSIIERIRAAGGRLVSLSENVDTQTPAGLLMLTILAAVAAMEVEVTKERSLVGRLQAAREGAWPQGSAPYGYRVENGHLVLDDTTAPHARTAFRALAEHGVGVAADVLNEQGVPPPRTRNKHGTVGRWHSSTLWRMTRNTAYAGEAVIEVAGERVTVPCPALLTRDEFDLIQRTPSNRNSYRDPSKYPLTGHLKCEHGAPMVGRTHPRTGSQHYFVVNHVKRRYECRCLGFPLRDAHQQARDALARVLRDPSDPAALGVLYGRPSAEDPHVAERAEIDAALERLARLQVLGQIDLEPYMTLRAELLARRESLRAPAPEDFSPPPAMLQLAEAVETATNEELAELLDVLGAQFVMTAPRVLTLVRLDPLSAA